MKKENFERLKKSLEQVLAYEKGEAEAGRLTVRMRPPKQVKMNLLLDEDIVQHFKRQAADSNIAPEINQALRKLIEPVAVSDEATEAIAERIAQKVIAGLKLAVKKKATEPSRPLNA